MAPSRRDRLFSAARALPAACILLPQLWNCDGASRLQEYLNKMYSRRSSMAMQRKHAEEPFDKCTSEYYSYGKKGGQSRKPVSQVPCNSSGDDNDDPDAGDAHGHSSTDLDTNGSDVSCIEDDAHAGHVSACGYSSSMSQKEGSKEQCGKLHTVNGLSAEHAPECWPSSFDAFDSSTKSLPLLRSSVDECDQATLTANKRGVCSSSPRGNGDQSVHNFARVCEVGCTSQSGSDKEEIQYGVNTSTAVSLSPSRGGHRRTFPPPLSSVATQSYCDKLGQSPGTCGAGYCLRSFRCNGRFVLQEVKAPTHKYFRVSREAGRLKLELINAVSESSAEEDEASASDACVGVGISDSVLGMVAESSYNSKVCVEDVSLGPTTPSLTVHAESTISPMAPAEETHSHAEELMSSVPTAGDCTACEKMLELADAPAISTEVGNPSKQMRPGALSTSEVHSKVSEAAPASPRCIEMRARYSGSGATMKSSWGRPISAF